MKQKSTRNGGGSFELKEGTGPITAMCPCGEFLEIYKKDKTFRIKSPEVIDPKETNPNAPWVASPISDVGSSNLIVARVLLQGHEILKSAHFERDVNKEAATSQLHSCKETLLSCQNVAKRVGRVIDSIVERIKMNGVSRDNQGRALNPFPQVPDLETDCATFLIQANRAIKIICEIPSFFLDLEKTDTNFDYLGRRLGNTIGDGAELTKLIKDNASTISYIIDLRNYQEHPGSIKTIIQNFSISPDGKIQVPTWSLLGGDNDAPQLIKEAMLGITDFLMQIAELVLIRSVMHSISSKFPFIIVETPMNEINADLPIKYRLSINMSEIGKHP